MANPRTIKGARRCGWTVTYIPPRKDRSWVGQLNWIAYNTKGRSVNEYKYQGDGLVAFENTDDVATAVLFLNANIV